MAGYVIHLAVAQEYLKLHPEEQYEEFIQGVIFPDSVKQKSTTHYGKSSAYTNLGEFLKENDINNSYKKGYFLHLLTDYLFYNYYLDSFNKATIYRDYDILNNKLIDKYKVNIPNNIKDKVFTIEGETQILHFELACEIIEEISKLDLEKIVEEARANDPKWNIYKCLI